LSSTRPPPTVERGLFVRGGALGDTLVALPALDALRARCRHLTFVGSPRYAALFAERCDAVIDGRGVESLWLHQEGPLPAPFDLALCFHAPLAAALQARGLPAVLALDGKPPAGVRVDQQLWGPLASAWGLPAAPPPPRLSPQAGPLRAIDDRLAGRRPLVFAPGAGAFDRQDTDSVALIEALQAAGHDLLGVVGPDDPRPAGLCLWADLDLPALCALAARCAGWIGMDSGTTHLAAAAGAPTLLRWRAPHSRDWAPAGAACLPADAPPAAVLAWAAGAGRRGI
jgi:hypothetical protein